MKAKELAEELFRCSDFDVEFRFSELDGSDYGMTVRRFENVHIGDIGHSEKIVILAGKEQK